MSYKVKQEKFVDTEIIERGKRKYKLEHYKFKESTWDADGQKRVLEEWDEWHLYKKMFFNLFWNPIGSGRLDEHWEYLTEAYYFDTRQSALDMIDHLESKYE